MGRAFALSNPRHGRSDGTKKIVAQRGCSGWGRFRFAHRRDHGIWSLLVSLSAHRPRQADELYDGTGIFPNHVRADRALRRLRRVLRVAVDERSTALESSPVQLGAL